MMMRMRQYEIGADKDGELQALYLKKVRESEGRIELRRPGAEGSEFVATLDRDKLEKLIQVLLEGGEDICYSLLDRLAEQAAERDYLRDQLDQLNSKHVALQLDSQRTEIELQEKIDRLEAELQTERKLHAEELHKLKDERKRSNDIRDNVIRERDDLLAKSRKQSAESAKARNDMQNEVNRVHTAWEQAAKERDKYRKLGVKWFWELMTAIDKNESRRSLIKKLARQIRDQQKQFAAAAVRNATRCIHDEMITKVPAASVPVAAERELKKTWSPIPPMIATSAPTLPWASAEGQKKPTNNVLENVLDKYMKEMLRDK